MENEWLEEFRAALSALGRSIYDYQEGRTGAFLDLYSELMKVARQVVKEYGVAEWSHDIQADIIRECVLHMTMCELQPQSDGTNLAIPGTSLIDQVNLTDNKILPFSYTVHHMTSFLQEKYQF